MNADAHSTPWELTQFIILAGPLGSGKTTLLEAVITAPNMATSTAVIINEAGAINIDGAILSDSAQGLPMATLSNGCVCCSLTNDLVFTVEELIASRAKSGSPPLARIILECSGLSKPGPVMRSLAGLAELRMRVSVVSTLDCSRDIGSSIDAQAELAQLAAAQVIVLTKGDLVSNSVRAHRVETVKRLNPFATVINEIEPHKRMNWACISGPTERHVQSFISRPIDSQRVQHPRIQVLHAQLEKPEWEDVQDWLENIASVLGERLLRIKALVNDPQGIAVLLQSVGTTFSAARRLSAPTTERTSVVFIVYDGDVALLSSVSTHLSVEWAS
ncbi:CobW family GTP-binding protein [Pseudomonas yamanorum]|uniref:CobW family GTP-binding protein n=1 Tax=Pseudomonas yamanorum TaxID=515393 RepID=UPI003B9F72CB